MNYTENNLKINNFLGEIGVDVGEYTVFDDQDQMYHPDDLLYNSDFDWLMLAVNHIKTLYKEVGVTEEKDMFWFQKAKEVFTDIDRLYEIVLTFLQQIEDGKQSGGFALVSEEGEGGYWMISRNIDNFQVYCFTDGCWYDEKEEYLVFK